MGNLYILIEGTPHKHEDFVKEVNAWKYDIEGNVAKGKQSPFISEVRLYDIRLPEQLESKFVRDLGIIDTSHKKVGNTVTSWKLRLGFKIYNFLMKFTPFHQVKPSEGEKQFSLSPWWYALCIGGLKRKKMKVTVNNNHREVQ